MAGAPTGRPRPGRVTVPTPGAGVQLDGAGRPVGREPDRGHGEVGAMGDIGVVAGVFDHGRPAGMARLAGIGVGHGETRPAAPRASPPPPRRAGRPRAGPTTAALAAAEAQVPVVQPVRSPWPRPPRGRGAARGASAGSPSAGRRPACGGPGAGRQPVGRAVAGRVEMRATGHRPVGEGVADQDQHRQGGAGSPQVRGQGARRWCG